MNSNKVWHPCHILCLILNFTHTSETNLAHLFISVQLQAVALISSIEYQFLANDIHPLSGQSPDNAILTLISLNEINIRIQMRLIAQNMISYCFPRETFSQHPVYFFYFLHFRSACRLPVRQERCVADPQRPPHCERNQRLKAEVSIRVHPSDRFMLLLWRLIRTYKAAFQSVWSL